MSIHITPRRAPGAGRPRRGSILAEFSLVFILFLLMSLGLFELGRAVWIHTTVAHVARKAARYAIVHGAMSPQPADSAAVRQVAVRNAVGLLPQRLTVTTAWEPDNNPGSAVRVQVLYNFQFVTGGFISSSSSLPLSAVSKMTIVN